MDEQGGAGSEKDSAAKDCPAPNRAARRGRGDEPARQRDRRKAAGDSQQEMRDSLAESRTKWKSLDFTGIEEH